MFCPENKSKWAKIGSIPIYDEKNLSDSVHRLEFSSHLRQALYPCGDESRR